MMAWHNTRRIAVGCSRSVVLTALGLYLLLAPSCRLFSSRTAEEVRAASPRARFNAAYRLVLGGHYESAAERLREVKDDPNPKNEYVDDATFWLGYCCQELGRTQDARLAYEEMVSRFPDSRYAATAQERLGQLQGK